MTPSELYQAGKLTEAVAAALEAVKKNPTEINRRGQLCELLLFLGDWERADKQLDTMMQQDPSTVIGVGLWRQLLRAEIARHQFFSEGRLPEFIGEPTPTLKLHLQASIAVREEKSGEAAQLLAQAEATRPQLSGSANGKSFSDFRDLDDLTSSFFEVLTSTGKYYWIPFESVELVEFHKPERPKDLLWRQAHMIVRDGPDGEVYLPSIYPSVQKTDDQMRLGRGTEWRGGDESPVRGVGLRMYLIGDEDHSILELQTLQFGAE